MCVVPSTPPPYLSPPPLVSYQAVAKSREFHEQQVMDWFVQMCFAIQYLHENKLVHNDIKVHIYITLTLTSL